MSHDPVLVMNILLLLIELSPLALRGVGWAGVGWGGLGREAEIKKVAWELFFYFEMGEWKNPGGLILGRWQL